MQCSHSSEALVVDLMREH